MRTATLDDVTGEIEELEPDDDQDDDLDDDDDEEEIEAAPVRQAARPRSTAERMADPKLRQPRAAPVPVAPAWWVGKSREEFTQSVADREEALRKDPAAAKVRTPVNHVE